MPVASTLAERVLVHLRDHPIDAHALDVPPGVTQEGIALAVGAQVAHVSRALKTLELRGLAAAHLAHAHGSKRRSRAYALTDAGHDAARALQAAPAPAEKPAPPRPPALVPAGRQMHLEALLGSLDEAARAGPRVALVEGEAGIGKSRLLQAFHREAERRGARVLAGRAAPTGAEQLVGPVGPALEPLGFERRVRGRTAGTPRERALAAAVEAIEASARQDLTVLLLDDLHLAGASVAEFVHGLVLALPPKVRVLVALAFRQEEAWELPNGPLYTALAPLRDLPGARHITLAPLDEASVRTLLVDAGAHHVDGALVERVARESGGNPLYALAMAEALADGVDEEDFFPAQVRALAKSRFADLAAHPRELLQAAAVCGAEVDYDLLARVQGGAEATLVESLDVLLDRLLLDEVPEASTLRLRFTHPKIREAVLAELSVPRRRLLEGRVAEAVVQQR